MDGMSNNSSERCSAGFDLKDSTEISVPQAGQMNGEPAAVKSGSFLPDGCLNDTSDVTSENANLPICPTNTKCLYQSGVFLDNLEGRNEGIVNPDDFLCDAHEQPVEVTEHQNAVSGSIFPLAEEMMPELNSELNPHDVSEVQSKLSVVSHAEADNCGGEFLGASMLGAETLHCELKIEDSNVEYNLNSLADGSMPTITAITTTQPQELVSDKNAVHNKSMNSIISCVVVQMTSPTAHSNAEDVVNGDCAVLPVDHSISSSCQECGPDACVKEDAAARVNANGFCMSTEFTSDSFGVNVVGVHDQEAPITQTDGALSLDGCLMSDRPQMNTKSSNRLASDSEVDHASVTQCNSESLCNAGSAPGVALHCASGGGNACAPDVLILSNQAS